MATELAAYLRPVLPVLQQFVAGEIDGQHFDDTFFRMYPDLPGLPADDVFDATERFWASAEDHVADEQLREPGDVTTEQLREKARELLRLAGM